MYTWFLKFIRRDAREKTAVTIPEWNHSDSNRTENLSLFHGIVGDNPLKHIDWIIENSLIEFNRWYGSYEDGSIWDLICTKKVESARAEWSLDKVDKVSFLPTRVLQYNYADSSFEHRHLEGGMFGYMPGTAQDKERMSLGLVEVVAFHNSYSTPKTFREMYDMIEHEEIMEPMKIKTIDDIRRELHLHSLYSQAEQRVNRLI